MNKTGCKIKLPTPNRGGKFALFPLPFLTTNIRVTVSELLLSVSCIGLVVKNTFRTFANRQSGYHRRNVWKTGGQGRLTFADDGSNVAPMPARADIGTAMGSIGTDATMFFFIRLVIGVVIFAAGLYYFRQEKNDSKSRRVYTITMAAGAVIAIGIIVKIIALDL